MTGLDQVDPVLAEDRRTILFYGYSTAPDQVFLASMALPTPISEQVFDDLRDEYRQLAPTLEWHEV